MAGEKLSQIAATLADWGPNDLIYVAEETSPGVFDKRKAPRTVLDPMLVRAPEVNSTAAGVGAGLAVTTGYHNVFFGRDAGLVNTTGINNIFIGFQAGRSNAITSDNVCIGNKAGQALVSGAGDNVFVGSYAGYSVTSGGKNSFFGTACAGSVTTGENNSCFGSNSGDTITTGGGNICIGRAATGPTSGSNNIIVGTSITVPVAANSNQLTIGNLIFGTGLDGTGTTVSSGNIGIGVPTPLAKLHIVSGGAIRLGNAAVAGIVIPTHTITFQDSTGTVYRVPCLV